MIKYMLFLDYNNTNTIYLHKYIKSTYHNNKIKNNSKTTITIVHSNDNNNNSLN